MCNNCNGLTIPIGPEGPQGLEGIQGLPGADGTNGTNGIDGVNGTTILASYNDVTGIGTSADLIETTLFTYNVPANTLNNVGDELELYTYYYVTPNANLTVRIKFGSKIFTINEAVANNVLYKIKISRINQNLQLWSLERITATQSIGITSSTVDLSTILTFEITAQNTVATSNQIVLNKATLYKYSI